MRSRSRAAWAVVAAVVLLAAVLLLAAALHTQILGGLGSYLVQAGPPEKADAALVLAGDNSGNRILTAVELMRQGYVRKVVVSELKDDTFYAVIWLDRDGELITVDSRPSDALALALRLDCPIFVEDAVLKSSKLAATVSDKVNNEELRRWLEGLNDEDLGRYKM